MLSLLLSLAYCKERDGGHIPNDSPPVSRFRRVIRSCIKFGEATLAFLVNVFRALLFLVKLPFILIHLLVYGKSSRYASSLHATVDPYSQFVNQPVVHTPPPNFPESPTVCVTAAELSNLTERRECLEASVPHISAVPASTTSSIHADGCEGRRREHSQRPKRASASALCPCDWAFD
jgi:hypothetical protein